MATKCPQMFPNALVASRSLAVFGLPADAVIVSSPSYFSSTSTSSNASNQYNLLHLITALIHVAFINDDETGEHTFFLKRTTPGRT